MFSGSIPALVTPFCDGAFSEKHFRALIDWQIDQGSSALVPAGTTGEASTLSNAEHHRVIEVCIEQAAGRVPVIAGCGSNDTNNAILHLNFSKKSGAAAGLVVAPYYNRPNQEGIYAHFEADDEEERPADRAVQCTRADRDRHQTGNGCAPCASCRR